MPNGVTTSCRASGCPTRAPRWRGTWRKCGSVSSAKLLKKEEEDDDDRDKPSHASRRLSLGCTVHDGSRLATRIQLTGIHPFSACHGDAAGQAPLLVWACGSMPTVIEDEKSFALGETERPERFHLATVYSSGPLPRPTRTFRKAAVSVYPRSISS
mmetsp:Transcript_22045/g.56267  ORF Transcript_22045/g.56267 Transcript_22045/m.56267 type:complete len:156 (+) Transcript_22045:680-1147(+)